MNDKVSLIIPVYNVEAYIRESLLSALNQTFEGIEYIIVDDCTTDRSMEVVRNVIENHPRGKQVYIYHHEQNKGLSAARNTGIRNSSGKYLFFMDSDDELSGDCIERHVRALENSSADFTVANIEMVGSSSIHTKPIFASLEEKHPFVSFCARDWNVSAGNKLYISSFIRDNALQFVEGLIHEDVLWSFALARHASKIAVVNERTYRYKIRDDSITTKPNSPKKIESLLFILSTMRNQFSCDCNLQKFKNEFTGFYDFYRFVSALQLLNYQGDYKQAKKYFQEIKSLKYNSDFSIHSLALSLPFRIFKTILSPAYCLYKKRK